MVIVRFSDEATLKKALSLLIGRCSGHSWATGQVVVPEEALACLASERISFSVDGQATLERIASLQNAAASAS